MRVLLWSDHFLPLIGGIELHLTMFLQEMVSRGYEFMVVTTRFDEALAEEELWHGIPIYRFDFADALSQGNVVSWMRQQKRLAQIVNGFDPELCHIFGMGASVLALLRLHKQRPLPILVRLSNTFTDPLREFGAEGIITKTLAEATWVTSVSQALHNQTIEHLPSLAARASVLYNGHPAPSLQPTPLATPARILFLGRLHPQKGCDLAIAAFAEVHKRYPAARLVIAGDGTERGQLQEQAAALGDAVEFLGWCQPAQVHALINRATLMLISSRWEGLPNVAIEAATMARPVVATAIPGMSEVVLDGQTGILVEPGKKQALAEAMIYLLDHPDQASDMGKAARAWAHKQFTIARCADEYERLYPRVVALHHEAMLLPKA